MDTRLPPKRRSKLPSVHMAPMHGMRGWWHSLSLCGKPLRGILTTGKKENVDCGSCKRIIEAQGDVRKTA